MPASSALNECEVILGNANKRFSGVTSTMLQTLEYQQHSMNICVLGKSHVPAHIKQVSFWQAARILRKPLSSGKVRVFHARRNAEMVQALILKHCFGAKIKILFTSTAQRYHTKLTRWLMSRMDRIISTCAAAASYLTPPPYALVPHGIRTDVYKPPSTDRQPEKHLVISMFGRVRKQKGSHLFVRACIDLLPQYPHVQADIVGAITPENSAFVDRLKREIAQAGLNERIRFLGEQKFEALPKLFQQASIVAALSRSEGFGLTILEAMSSGAAVLATEAGAWPEIIEQGEQGFVVPIENQAAITQQLQVMLDKPEQLNKMGACGRERVLNHYTIENEANRLCEIYRELQQEPLAPKR